MKESEIQSILENLIQEENFLNCIKNIDSIEKLYESFHEEDKLPSFSIDYLSRKKMIVAAKNIVSLLGSSQIITTASKNISLERKEKLFPDLVLFHEEKCKLIILEIKRSVKTARETLTEMLAYDHEIRNLLPFLSNFEIVFCIVSTDYSTLLNHSVAGLITWESKQILCLHARNSEKKELELEIHLPPSWTSFGMSHLPASAISTTNIVLYKNSDDESSKDAEAAIFYAASLIAKEGDRNNSHGFVIVWRDSWKYFDGAADYCLIVGFINPYSFLPFAQEIGAIDASQNPLGQYFLEHSNNYPSYYCGEVVKKGITFLKKYFKAHIEGFSNWIDDRSKAHQVYFPINLLRHRAIPLRVELWGALGDFSRELIVHPGFEKHIASKFPQGVLGCEDPFVAIPLIDSISGNTKIDDRGFTCKTLFDLGVSLGMLSTLYNTAINSEKDDLKNLPASITWTALDIYEVLMELFAQYNSSDDLKKCPPLIKFNIDGEFEKSLEEITSLVDWIFSEFLQGKRTIHRECFNVGLIMYPLLDELFSGTLPEKNRKSISKRVIDSSTNILKLIATECLSEYTATESIEIVMGTFSEKYLDNCEVNFNKEALLSLVKKVSDESHLSLYHDTLMDLIDMFTIPINYRNFSSQKLSEYKYIDWTWIREEILGRKRNKAVFPALRINSMGRVEIIDVAKEVYFSGFKHINLEEEFIFVTSSSSMEMAIVHKWNEFIS